MLPSVCQQGRYLRVRQDVSRDAAEDYLTEARMAVGTHDDKIR